MDEKKFWHINLMVSKTNTILLILVIALTATILYITEFPHPLILEDPPFPEGSLVNYEEIALRNWSPSSKTHIWRKNYLIGLGNCCETLNSSEKIFTFLDEWLKSKGWIRWDEVGDPCSSMDETEFLNRNKEYIAYVPSGTKNLSSSPSVCIAVWSWKEDIYSVLVVTRNK